MSDKHDNGQNKDNGDLHGHPDSIGAVQFAAIAAAAAVDGVTFETEPKGGAPHYIWQKDHILVAGDVDEKSNQELIDLGAELATNLDEKKSQQQTSTDRVKLLRLTKVPNITTREIVKDLNRPDALRGKVFLNHLLYVTHNSADGANLCPANEPMVPPQTDPYPPASPDDAGRDVRVTVYDTGLSPGWQIDHPWLYDMANQTTEVSGETEPETYDLQNGGDIESHAGHGVFIAGVIRCVAPRAMVTVKKTLRWAGAMLESEISRVIREDLNSATPPHIISLSAGCTIPEDEDYPVAVREIMTQLSLPGRETLLVAAAGNDAHGPGKHGRFFPAAFTAADPKDPWAGKGLVVAVGALRQDRKGRACFSNYGEWVTLYEDGENLVNAFPIGRYTYHEPVSQGNCTYYPNTTHKYKCCCVTAPDQGSFVFFTDGMASWSGTSFATPIFVGRVARYMAPSMPTPPAGSVLTPPRLAAHDVLLKLIEIPDARGDIQLKVFEDGTFN